MSGDSGVGRIYLPLKENENENGSRRYNLFAQRYRSQKISSDLHPARINLLVRPPFPSCILCHYFVRLCPPRLAPAVGRFCPGCGSVGELLGPTGLSKIS